MIAVACCDLAGAVGKDGGLAVEDERDMRVFRELTTGGALIMGRRTHENIVSRAGGTLSDRSHVVLTTRGADEVSLADEDDVTLAGHAAAALRRASNRADEVFCVGGVSCWETMLPACDELWLTIVHRRVDGADAFFPDWRPSDHGWLNTGGFGYAGDIEWRKYRRRRASA